MIFKLPNNIDAKKGCGNPCLLMVYINQHMLDILDCIRTTWTLYA